VYSLSALVQGYVSLTFQHQCLHGLPFVRRQVKCPISQRDFELSPAAFSAGAVYSPHHKKESLNSPAIFSGSAYPSSSSVLVHDPKSPKFVLK
jgi:hypothetical protein